MHSRRERADDRHNRSRNEGEPISALVFLRAGGADGCVAFEYGDDNTACISLGQGLVWGMATLLLIAALKLWRDTGVSVRLVGTRLEDSHGALIVQIEDVETLTRTHFSFRPSNGFMLSLKREYDPRWCMGLYWRAGKRAAFGGAVSGAEAKKLAEAIERHLSQRRETA